MADASRQTGNPSVHLGHERRDPPKSGHIASIRFGQLPLHGRMFSSPMTPCLRTSPLSRAVRQQSERLRSNASRHRSTRGDRDPGASVMMSRRLIRSAATCAAGRAAEMSGQFGDGQQHRGVLQRLEAVPGIGNLEQITRSALPRRVADVHPDAAP